VVVVRGRVLQEPNIEEVDLTGVGNDLVLGWRLLGQYVNLVSNLRTFFDTINEEMRVQFSDWGTSHYERIAKYPGQRGF
jgi:hypothetical protein